MEFQKVESYMHKYAKKVLLDWFKNSNTFLIRGKGICTDITIGWKLEDSYCLEEYPVHVSEMYNSLDKIWKTKNGTAPDWKLCVDAHYNPAFIFDLVLIENEKVKYGFEIFHKHKCDETKIEKIKYIHSNSGNILRGVFEISAEWIMNQITIPSYLYIDTVIL